MEAGGLASHTWEEVRHLKHYNNPERRKEWSERDRARRKTMCGLYTQTSFNKNNPSIKNICETMMNAPNKKIGEFSMKKYTETMSAVYIWMCTQLGAGDIEREATRFITDGQNWGHNAILMWNPRGVLFEENICMHGEQYDHGFLRIGLYDCRELGIDWIILVDDNVMTRSDCCKIEQGCQYKIDHLKLGSQRMHRVPGAGLPHSIGVEEGW
jgi:hypothetical protein